MPNSPDQYESHDSYNPHETKNYQNLQIAGATGKAKQLLETHGDLRGHPVWMGIGVNGIYNDEMVLAYINWALQHNAGTFWLVLAHELVAENKTAFKRTDYHQQREMPEDDAEHIEIDTLYGLRKILLTPETDEARYKQTAERAKHLAKISEYRELAQERKERIRKKAFKELKLTQSPRVAIATIEEVYEHVLRPKTPTLDAQKSLYAESMMTDKKFQADMQILFQEVVPNFDKEMRAGKVHMPSAYNYTLNQLMLTYFLSEQAGVGIKIGPPTEQGPDQIYTNFIGGKYNTRLRNPRNQGNQGFLYIK